MTDPRIDFDTESETIPLDVFPSEGTIQVRLWTRGEYVGDGTLISGPGDVRLHYVPDDDTFDQHEPGGADV